MRFLFFRSANRSAFRLSMLSAHLSPFISVPFLLGILAGSIVGCFGTQQIGDDLLSCVPELFPISTDSSAVAWYSVRFLLASLLLGTSVLGVFLLPALAGARAFFLSCAVAAVLQARSFQGFRFAILFFGVSSALSIPAFLLLTQDAFAFSRRLTRRSSASIESFSMQAVFYRVFLVCVLCASEIAYRSFLLPKILN